MKRIGCLIWSSLLALWLACGNAWAQDLGQPGTGRNLARQLCSECHAIEKTEARSANSAAPRFEAIANTRGMTATALSAALHTSHRTMPNVILERDDLSNIVAYILSLRRGS